MSFSFGFSAKDLSDDDLVNEDQIVDSQVGSAASAINPLDASRLLEKGVVQPQWEDLKAIIGSLNDVRISYEEFRTPHNQTVLYRRELFDVKHQLMSEATGNEEDSVELDILIGETSEDLRKNVYEGGLKSWECSVDVVDYMSDPSGMMESVDCVLELGCGTALPTEYIFATYLKQQSSKGISLILSDYNKSVLRLVTIPNLIITWAKLVLSEEQCAQLQQCNDENSPVRPNELLLTGQLLDSFYQDLQAKNIRLDLVSGTWGRSFSNLLSTGLNAQSSTLVITSETIYQPENLPVVAETLLDVILTNKDSKVKALVAAKDIYFGVGGSMMEFENYISTKIRAENLPVDYHTHKVDAGLKRSIMFIE